ncbi:hypothetical protein VTO73DRAFT_13589 [Trametes versicolor]
MMQTLLRVPPPFYYTRMRVRCGSPCAIYSTPPTHSPLRSLQIHIPQRNKLIQFKAVLTMVLDERRVVVQPVKFKLHTISGCHTLGDANI